MLSRRPWRRSKSVDPTSPRGHTSGSGNSRADAFPITAPLSHTPKSTLWSTNALLSSALPKLWLTYDNGESGFCNQSGHRDTETRVFSWWPSSLLTYKKQNVFTTLFLCLQPPHALETGVRQLHDWRNSRAAVRREHLWVQHCGGQHGEETTRGLICPEPESNPLHHHLISNVL